MGSMDNGDRLEGFSYERSPQDIQQQVHKFRDEHEMEMCIEIKW